ncbi:MAG TPA: hypothetical protein VIG93_04995 [Gaiellaceae bacterium]
MLIAIALAVLLAAGYLVMWLFAVGCAEGDSTGTCDVFRYTTALWYLAALLPAAVFGLLLLTERGRQQPLVAIGVAAGLGALEYVTIQVFA